MASRRAVSVIVPVRNDAPTLVRVLNSILTSNLPRASYELLVVDDASTDGSPEVAARYADTVVRLTGRKTGPAYARNRGAELAQADVLVFVDPDALLQPDTLQRMLKTLADYPSLDAVSAAHNGTCEARNLVSQYGNLMLHFGEKRESAANGNVGSPCTAIRREAFLSAGMYDEWRFETAPVEGIELGTRLKEAGRDVFCSKDLQITVLKRWNLVTFCRDVFNRSVLVARSLGYRRARRVVPGDIVFTLVRSAVPVFAALCVAAFSAAFRPRPDLLIGLGLVCAGAFALNLREYIFFAKARGIPFALAVAPLHVLMQAISGLGLCAGWVLRDTFGDRAPDATTQAYAEVGMETWPPVPRAPRTTPAQRPAI
ncbi:MAG TPA: glycosyltransferase family 2 protein [Gemmatimonadaceae bacterium]|jgi:glycosyltransferase involved in cell wall biosynthesis|nr:glycosyltransferase family 2 protein [Gemmatimonadaceae bacterium]